MRRYNYLLAFLSINILALWFVFSILFERGIIEASTNLNNEEIVMMTNYEISSFPKHWLNSLFSNHHFYVLNNTIYVTINEIQDTVYITPVYVLFLNALFSNLGAVLVSLIILFALYVFKTHKVLNEKENKLICINSKINNILKLLNIDLTENKLNDPSLKLSTALAKITENINKIKNINSHNILLDKLTSLVDRHAYLEHLEIELEKASTNTEKCGLLFIDLDGFKQVNDSFGHSFGDQILVRVASRLLSVAKKHNIQSINPTFDIEQNVSRLGGDEFSVFIPNINNSSACVNVAESILCAIEKDINLGNKIIKISASIGIAEYPESASKPQALLQMADVAMYRAKTDGRGIFRIYSPDMGQKMRRYHYLIEELRLAIAAEAFQLSFQPIIDTEDCVILYFEALVRWHHPVEGLIPPSEFIPIAEESNLILELGDWILKESCKQMAKWHLAGMNKIKISVNVSGIQLKHRNAYKWVKKVLAETGLPASSLMLEITESTLITMSDDIVNQLEACRADGVLIAIDDFGTGFSSLSTLADLPIDVIKIDKLFITHASNNSKYLKILNSITELAHKLNLKIVAEGVEDIEQFELVKKLGVLCVQGYLVSRPETSTCVDTKVLNQNINRIAITGTSVWGIENK
jgi:diguanylate cyclase